MIVFTDSFGRTICPHGGGRRGPKRSYIHTRGLATAIYKYIFAQWRAVPWSARTVEGLVLVLTVRFFDLYYYWIYVFRMCTQSCHRRRLDRFLSDLANLHPVRLAVYAHAPHTKFSSVVLVSFLVIGTRGRRGSKRSYTMCDCCIMHTAARLCAVPWSARPVEGLVSVLPIYP